MRVQQVSPSMSPAGALSVFTDSFSLAGILTAREGEGEREREERESDELPVKTILIAHQRLVSHALTHTHKQLTSNL